MQRAHLEVSAGFEPTGASADQHEVETALAAGMITAHQNQKAP